MYGKRNIGKSVCSTHAPILTSKARNCEVSLLLGDKNDIKKNCETKIIPFTNYIIQLGKTNRYFIFASEVIAAREKCQNVSPVIVYLKSPQILEIKPKCSITLLNIQLKSHSSSKFNKSGEITAHLDFDKLKFEYSDIASNLSSPQNAIILDNPSDFTDILNSMDNLENKIKTEKKIETISTQSEQMGYGLLASVICGILLLTLVIYIFVSKIAPTAARIARLANRIPVV